MYKYYFITICKLRFCLYINKLLLSTALIYVSVEYDYFYTI